MSLWDDIHREWERSQAVQHYVIEGDRMPRVSFGHEANRMSLSNCPECNSSWGEMHMLGCTTEQCPLCDERAYSCCCEYEKRPGELMRE